jgi:uncharacterized protein with PIN domain
MPKCPHCGDENHIYDRADVRWQDGDWTVGDVEELLECTECGEEFYYGEAGFDDLPNLELSREDEPVHVPGLNEALAPKGDV